MYGDVGCSLQHSVAYHSSFRVRLNISFGTIQEMKSAEDEDSVNFGAMSVHYCYLTPIYAYTHTRTRKHRLAGRTQAP